MPKITLLNTVTGKTQDFEPVDAREVLQTVNTIYKIPDTTKAAISRENGNQQSDKSQIDPEMQLGKSQDKYGRSDIVLAQGGKPFIKPVESTFGGPMPAVEPIDSGWLTIPQLQSELDTAGVQYTAKMNKAELVALYEKTKKPA